MDTLLLNLDCLVWSVNKSGDQSSIQTEDKYFNTHLLVQQDLKTVGCLLTTIRCSGKEKLWEEFCYCIRVFLHNRSLRSSVRDTKLRTYWQYCLRREESSWQWKGESSYHRETVINNNIYRTLSKVMGTSSSSCLTLSEDSPLKYLVACIFSTININTQEHILLHCTMDVLVRCVNSEFGLVTEFPWGSCLILLLCPFTEWLCFPSSPML